MHRSKRGWILLEGMLAVSGIVLLLMGGAVFFHQVSARYRELVAFDAAVMVAQGEIERAVAIGGAGKKTVVIDGTHRLEVILAP